MQSQTCSITGDGVAAAESVPDWNDAAMTTDSVPMRVTIEFEGVGTKVIEGQFHVDSEAFAAEAGGRVTLAINAQSDGAVTAVWTRQRREKPGRFLDCRRPAATGISSLPSASG